MNFRLTAGSCALVAGVLANIAGAATTMRLQVAEAGSELWSSSINAKPGDAVDIRVTVSFTGGPVTPIGLSSTIFQPTVSNWQIGGDALAPMVASGSNTTTPSGAVSDSPGQYGRVSPFAGVVIATSARLFGHVHAASATTGGVSFLRIAQRQVTSWFGGPGNTSGGSGINIKQWNINSPARTLPNPQPAFLTQLTDIVILKFKIVLSTDPSTRTLTVDAPLAGFVRVADVNNWPGHPYIGWYTGPNGDTPHIADLPTIEQGFINIPAPGAAALCLAGLLAIRRRR
ncbi:MAG TPA: hypothetical protein VD997_15135 [Phycisphaerales bacterium]|nr:hypothetical protein [Phycisphaerales bacterium]